MQFGLHVAEDQLKSFGTGNEHPNDKSVAGLVRTENRKRIAMPRGDNCLDLVAA
jgi:hypothetical protein